MPPPRRPARDGDRSGRDGDDPASPPRIIGGSLRGRRLPYQPDPRTRPMKDRVREVLFNLLGTDVVGAVAVDPFGGTGALGFEALSRGAAAAFFGERHFPTADALRRSAVELGLGERVTVRPGDALLWARKMPEIPRGGPWIVFFSPPWDLFTSRSADLLALLAALLAAAPPGSLAVVEADDAFDPAALPEASAWQRREVPPAVLFLRSLSPAA
ncbi:MAG: RsmD family RNA methyltransferase [Planctomycetaceae bacterium]